MSVRHFFSNFLSRSCLVTLLWLKGSGPLFKQTREIKRERRNINFYQHKTIEKVNGGFMNVLRNQNLKSTLTPQSLGGFHPSVSSLSMSLRRPSIGNKISCSGMSIEFSLPSYRENKLRNGCREVDLSGRVGRVVWIESKSCTVRSSAKRDRNL